MYPLLLFTTDEPTHNSTGTRTFNTDEGRMTKISGSANGRIAAVSPDNTTVGIVGLGDMGAAIASSIVRTFPLIAFDLRKEAVDKMVSFGAKRAESGQALADPAEV